MQVTQYGLQDCFKRAYAAIVNANMASGLDQGAANAAAQNAVMSQSYLRLEQPLATNASIFQFPILANQTGSNNPVRATEVRLAQQDSFFCSSIAIYITVASSATATNFVLETYPSPTVFTTGAASLYTLYNGFIQVNINKSIIIPNLAMNNFLQVPQTQKTAATNSPIDQYDPSQVFLFEPNINFVGTKNSQITAVLPSNMTTLDANTYMVIIMQGILAQNVTLMS